MKTLHALAPYCLLILIGAFIFSPVLFFGKAFFGEEQMGFYYAISFAVSKALHAGVIPLWQGSYYGGVSTSLDQFYGNFYTVNLFLFSQLPFFLAHHLSITIATTLGLIFSYSFGRELGWRRASALSLAFFYFSATTLQWLEIGTIAAHSFMILPAMLWALLYASKVRTRRAYALAVMYGGFALGIGFLAGFMQIVFYNYCIAGAYALFLEYEGYDKTKKLLVRFPLSLVYAASILLALLLGFKQFFPSAHLINLTIRTNTYAFQNAYHPFVGELLPFFLPPNFSIPYLGGGSSSGFYIGALGLLFTLLGLRLYRTRTSLFFAGLYACMFALGFHLPLFGWLNEHVPPFSHMGGNFRWMVGAAFPLAFLGAAGIEGFLRFPLYVSKKLMDRIAYVAGAIAAVFLIGSFILAQALHSVTASPTLGLRILTFYAHHHPLHKEPAYYLSLLGTALQKTADTFSVHNPPFLFGIVCWVLVSLFFYSYRRVPQVRTHSSLIILAIVLYTTLGAPVFEWQNFVPQSLYTREAVMAKAINAHEENPHTYRILGFLLGDGLFDTVFKERTLAPEDMTALQLQLLINNSNIYSGIERMDGMEPYRTLRVNRLLDTVIGYNSAEYVFNEESPALKTSALDQLYNRDVQISVTPEGKRADFIRRLPLLSMMNVKYIYSLYPLESPRLALAQKFSIPAGEKMLDVYLYQNRDVLPRVYFAVTPVIVHGSDTDTLMKVVTTQNFKGETVIECAQCAEQTAGGGAVQALRYDAGNVLVKTSTVNGSWLVLSENFIPGWHATIDGKPAPLHPANYLFQAVQVPAGEHIVQFVYTDPSAL